jgi:hypothetical protein
MWGLKMLALNEFSRLSSRGRSCRKATFLGQHYLHRNFSNSLPPKNEEMKKIGKVVLPPSKIFSLLPKYIWPEGDYAIRARVLFAFGFLVSSKVTIFFGS